MGLSKSEIEDFKQKLLQLRKEHQHTLQETTQNVKTGDDARGGGSQHHADEGTDDFGRTISIEVSTTEIDMIKQIDRALEKVEEGTYGICDITEEPIPKKRLDAIPYAIMTVEAQSKLEKGLL